MLFAGSIKYEAKTNEKPAAETIFRTEKSNRRNRRTLEDWNP